MIYLLEHELFYSFLKKKKSKIYLFQVLRIFFYQHRLCSFVNIYNIWNKQIIQNIFIFFSL